jgi:hypothetical protein
MQKGAAMDAAVWVMLALGVMILLALWMLGSYLRSILGELVQMNHYLKKLSARADRDCGER